MTFTNFNAKIVSLLQSFIGNRAESTAIWPNSFSVNWTMLSFHFSLILRFQATIQHALTFFQFSSPIAWALAFVQDFFLNQKVLCITSRHCLYLLPYIRYKNNFHSISVTKPIVPQSVVDEYYQIFDPQFGEEMTSPLYGIPWLHWLLLSTCAVNWRQFHLDYKQWQAASTFRWQVYYQQLTNGYWIMRL